jgi:protein-L-isoaspartate(D-aspartate) O-methyltransferase
MNQRSLTDYLIRIGYLKSPHIIRAFESIDRADFLLPEFRESAYEDIPLPINYGQTNSQPATVAFMLELLQPAAGDRVLDIGSGSGWTTALLAEIVGETGRVVGVELIPELVEFGSTNLSKYGFNYAKIIQADPFEYGYQNEAPYDKILVSASSDELKEEFINQMKVGSRLVIPIKQSIWKIDKVSDTDIRKEEYAGFVFVPLS